MTIPKSGARQLRSNPDSAAGCILVLGVPRGGTSVVAGLLRIAGVPMGDFIDKLNQEDLEFRDIGYELRSHRQTGLDDPRMVDARHRFQRLHDLRTAHHELWGFKDPTLIDYLADVIQFVKNPRLICVLRSPVSSALREEMAGNSFDVSLRSAVLRQTRIVDFVDACDFPILFVSYEKLLLRPWETFGVISRFVTGGVDTSLQEAVVRYVVPERTTAAIENLDDSFLRSNSTPPV